MKSQWYPTIISAVCLVLSIYGLIKEHWLGWLSLGLSVVFVIIAIIILTKDERREE